MRHRRGGAARSTGLSLPPARRPRAGALPRPPTGPVGYRTVGACTKRGHHLAGAAATVGYTSAMRGNPMSERHMRLSTPLVREDGILRPASWDEALERAARGFRAAVDRRGPETFGLFSCSKTTNEMNYLAQKFARVVVGSNNIDSCNRT
jgi:hypothetical protein